MAWILRDHRRDLKLSVVSGFRLGERNAADGLEQAPVVEPVDPFEGGEFDGLKGSCRRFRGGAPITRASELAQNRTKGTVVSVDLEMMGPSSAFWDVTVATSNSIHRMLTSSKCKIEWWLGALRSRRRA